jgi:hypothetical protein
VLRKKRAKVEAELAAVIAAYDQSMREKRAEIEALVELMEGERKELQELQVGLRYVIPCVSRACT